jgi:hypothetical protein
MTRLNVCWECYLECALGLLRKVISGQVLKSSEHFQGGRIRHCRTYRSRASTYDLLDIDFALLAIDRVRYVWYLEYEPGNMAGAQRFLYGSLQCRLELLGEMETLLHLDEKNHSLVQVTLPLLANTDAVSNGREVFDNGIDLGRSKSDSSRIQHAVPSMN